MLNLKLDLKPETEKRLKQVLSQAQNQENFAQNVIAYQILELKKAILNIRLDLELFEKQYKLASQNFYLQFQQGKREDSEDFMIWAGLYEMFCDNEKRLQELQ